jgi:hypothetical protein
MTRSRAISGAFLSVPFLGFATGGFLTKRLLQKRYFFIGAHSAHCKLLFKLPHTTPF